MSDNRDVIPPERGLPEVVDTKLAVSSGDISSVTGSVHTAKTQSRVSSSSERQIKFERAQKCLENAALVSKRIKEHRKATAELLGRPFEDDGDTASELGTTMSERTGYSVATDPSTTLSVQEALNIPGISESLANTLKQKELLMERIKQYKEISKRPTKSSQIPKKDSVDAKELRKTKDNTDLNQLANIIKDKENTISVMVVKMRAMETTILDLQEKITEKDQIIDAKNKASNLMSDSLSKKEKDSIALLEDTKQQMIKMQENFVNMEAEWKDEREQLLKEIESKDVKISSLEEANTLLENSRFELSVQNSKLLEALELNKQEIVVLQYKIQELSSENKNRVGELTQKEQDDVEEEKGSREITNMAELTKKVELLEQLNCQIRQTNKELETKLATVNMESKTTPSGSPSKKASPLPTRKGSRNTSKAKSPWSNLSTESIPQETDKKPTKNEKTKLEMMVQSLSRDIIEKEYLISQKDVTISELHSLITQNESIIKDLRSHTKNIVDIVDVEIQTDIIETEEARKHIQFLNSELSEGLSLDPKQLHEIILSAQSQITGLNNEIDAANKNMIKVKSNHKLKLRQMQKTIDNFSKVSDASAEIVRLNEELHQLSQKVAELEEEKGNLQLHLVDYDSGRLTESDVYKKMIEMENLAETRLKAISVLESQKFDLVQELHELQQKYAEMEDKLEDMSSLHSEQVSSEIKSVQLEEQVDQLSASKQELELIIKNVMLDKDQLDETIKAFEEEKDELLHKLEHYIQENMDLTDKLEKLSAEKVSSAESIEIVESLTTQEKLELEEYNKSLSENQEEGRSKLLILQESRDNIEQLVEQSAELNRKIELFTQEREEVMEKMCKLNSENETLHQKISEISSQCIDLQRNIDLMKTEKQEWTSLNKELNRQIEEVKRERLEILKESVEIAKPAGVDETLEGALSEAQQDDNLSGDKGNSRTKSVKQLTKDILKLKNTIKEREADIGDCQVKILALEEQQQKHNEVLQSVAQYETRVKSLTDENQLLKEELGNLQRDKQSEQQMLQTKQAQEVLLQEMHNLRQEYAKTINARDSRIYELENLLVEYEKQIFNYGNTLQEKDKEMTEYMNQITKLNDVSQKLKSTIECLEEEKVRDPNAELVKTLNKQISANQKKLSEYEDTLRILEEEKAQLLSIRGALENKNLNLDVELKKLQELFVEKQNLIKDLQAQHLKHAEEMSNVAMQVKERDEEIHEIKLQLRKESIENEKLRKHLSEKDVNSEEFTKQIEKAKETIQQLALEKNNFSEQHVADEMKNKELMDKLKKFAASVKKKSSMYTELENRFHETQQQLETKTAQLEDLLIQVDTLPGVQEKLKHAEEELNRLHCQKIALEQQTSQDVEALEYLVKSLEEKLKTALNNAAKLIQDKDELNKELLFAREEALKVRSQFESMNNKLADCEIDLKNATNFSTKISSLEAEIIQKELYVSELLHKLQESEQQLSQVQFGHDAKLQERDMYIESLEFEINKYQQRINRLEESISVMEDNRHSIERKADQLDSQLQEKQKAYSDYTSQEDQLVGRLAVLMEHDRVVEKQLHEIEKENKEMQLKLQQFSEDNQRLRKSLSDIQDHCSTLEEKASKTESVESELAKYQSQLRELDSQLKKVTYEHQTLFQQKKHDIEELELEFNTQIENSFKEKKLLSEKYERINEHVSQLDFKLQEYRNTNETLKINIEELTRINEELIEKSTRKYSQAPDYTDQYIAEINRLNALLNMKNQEISDVSDKIQCHQSDSVAMITNLNSKIAELNTKLQHSSTEIEKLTEELTSSRILNEQLQVSLNQKDEQLRQLMEKKTVTFEMNIPKTEGMIISSTIEEMDEEPKQFDVSSLESQIVSKSDKIQKATRREEETFDIEPTIVPKKTYLCYKREETLLKQAEDPFNSDEGWGLGESEDFGDSTQNLTHYNEQILQLQKDNKTLKAALDLSNNKLLKAMKKLKELKSKNDMLTNELNISKQITQSSSSLLDSAIEDELKLNIQGLEKKIEELTIELSKENREKQALKANNMKIAETKEKLDNEVEMWKFKFKQAQDQMLAIRSGADTSDLGPIAIPQAFHHSISQDEFVKLEEENDQLQSLVEKMTNQIKELSAYQSKLKFELSNVTEKLEESQSNNQMLDKVNIQLLEIKKNNSDLIANNEIINDKSRNLEERFSEITQIYESLSIENQKLEHKCQELDEDNQKLKATSEKYRSEFNTKSSEFEREKQAFKESKLDSQNKISCLTKELEDVKSKSTLHDKQQHVHNAQFVDILQLSDKCSSLEDYCAKLKQNLEDANDKVSELEAEIEQLRKTDASEQDVKELNEKIQHLNIENDQLLSTVTELRSSVSSAVDQRGYEIAELWKQHLAQREADFQQIEHELRTQITMHEAKYEQLLDSVQSSSQEEAKELVTMEQVTKLQTKLQDKEEHLQILQNKYAEVIIQIDMLRSEMQDEKLEHEHKLLTQQEDYEKQIKELFEKNKQHTEGYNEAYVNLQTELTETKTKNEKQSQDIQELQIIIQNCEEKVLELTNELRAKDSEIYQKTHDYTITLSHRGAEFENVRKQLLEYEKKVEDLNYEKESELAVLRLKMHDMEGRYEKIKKESDVETVNLTEALNAKIIECTDLNKRIAELNKILEEHSSNPVALQAALENQELEIVTLKDEINNLREVLRSPSGRLEKHVTFASNTKPGSDDEKPKNTLDQELLDAVPRAELDLALYMLHQRDVRCEELTMELTQLLDERDTLQIRLSDCLRSYEDLKSKCVAGGLDVSISASFDSVTELSSTSEKDHLFVDTHRGQTSRSSSICDPDGDNPKLHAKLSELRTVKQSRDVLLRHDSEQRQIHMRLMQRDVANLPPEAREQLAQAQAQHTLSRDSQSTPTVLLNWLRGKSTPKVVHM